jgi:hypothetical protein
LQPPARADEREDHWQKGDPRPFLTAAADIGSLEHVALAAGYGKPHFMWGGLIAHGSDRRPDTTLSVNRESLAGRGGEAL